MSDPTGTQPPTVNPPEPAEEEPQRFLTYPEAVCTEVKIHAKRSGMIWTVRTWAAHAQPSGELAGHTVNCYETPALDRDGNEIHPSEVIRRAVYRPTPKSSRRR